MDDDYPTRRGNPPPKTTQQSWRAAGASSHSRAADQSGGGENIKRGPVHAMDSGIHKATSQYGLGFTTAATAVVIVADDMLVGIGEGLNMLLGEKYKYQGYVFAFYFTIYGIDQLWSLLNMNFKVIPSYICMIDKK